MLIPPVNKFYNASITLLTEKHGHAPAFHLGRPVDNCDICQLFGKYVKDLLTALYMRHLASAETKRYLDLVTLLDELSGSIDFRIQIVVVNIRRQTNFFDFDGFLLLSGFLFFSCPHNGIYRNR